MFGNLKLEDNHKMLVKSLAKELNEDENKVLYEIVEMGFAMIRLGTEDDKMIKDAYDLVKKDDKFMGKAKLIRKWWDDGGEASKNNN